jgi:hypothetical protein|tara:strand:+ start:1956 stop:2174 length:219 start_codon:yes stop_codon:yes gene_type:complete
MIAVKKGPDDRINKVDATDVYIIENTYPEKEIDRKIPTIRSLESNPLIKFGRDWRLLKQVKRATIALKPIER